MCLLLNPYNIFFFYRSVHLWFISHESLSIEVLYVIISAFFTMIYGSYEHQSKIPIFRMRNKKCFNMGCSKPSGLTNISIMSIIFPQSYSYFHSILLNNFSLWLLSFRCLQKIVLIWARWEQKQHLEKWSNIGQISEYGNFGVFPHKSHNISKI